MSRSVARACLGIRTGAVAARVDMSEVEATTAARVGLNRRTPAAVAAHSISEAVVRELASDLLGCVVLEKWRRMWT